MLAWASFPKLGCMQNNQNRAVFTESFVCIFWDDDKILKYSNVIIFKRPSVSPTYCTTTAHALVYTGVKASLLLPPLLLLSLPSSLHPLLFFFPHSYNSWAVLSHTRLLRISEDVDDYDDNSNHVFWMSCFNFRGFFFSLYIVFSSFVFQKRSKNREKKRCKVLFLNYV